MGFGRPVAFPILREHARRPWSGHAVCLGRADVHFGHEALLQMARLTGARLDPDAAPTPSHRDDLAARGCISDRSLFAALGFAKLSTLDLSNFEGAEIQFDLNSPELPPSLAQVCDAVFDHGTMEHVFHVPHFFANVHGLLKVGGRVVHCSPTANWIDHGFYMFSPTLFLDFYEANGWRVHALEVVRFDPQKQDAETPFFASYEPGVRIPPPAEHEAYLTVCIAEKLENSTARVVPQQGYYRRTPGWREEPEPAGLTTLALRPPFQHAGGHCWQADLSRLAADRGDSMAEPQRSPLRLLENGERLGPGHSVHDTIRSTGRGRYSHWGQTLYFSTSDNSDPNSNRRRYEVKVRPA